MDFSLIPHNMQILQIQQQLPGCLADRKLAVFRQAKGSTSEDMAKLEKEAELAADIAVTPEEDAGTAAKFKPGIKFRLAA